MANSTTVHCELSRCEITPDYCETELRTDEIVQLILMVLVPIAIAIFAPRLSVVSAKVWRQDDDIPSTIHKYDGIDPPMFLCGVGLLPLDCGLSGLLTVVGAMAFGFVVIYFSLLFSSNPCSTALGACRTISCACGNIITEGYVFMFGLLTLTSAILVQRISAMPQHHRVQHRMIKPTLILGSLMLTLTGIFPERYDVNGGMDGMLYLLYSLHLLGVFGSGTSPHPPTSPHISPHLPTSPHISPHLSPLGVFASRTYAQPPVALARWLACTPIPRSHPCCT